MNDIRLSRRHFLRLGAGTIVVVGLGACSSSGANDSGPLGTAGPLGTTRSSVPGSSVPGSSVPAGSTVPGAAGARRLVIVQLNGGNDGLNTLIPHDGRYHDARPSLAIADADLVGLAGTSEVSFHPGLAALAPMWTAGKLAVVRGIGFSNPNRSHFVSMDRWWRADDVHAPGWLGRVLDSMASEPAPLYATSLGGGAPLLSGAHRQGAAVGSAGGFTFGALDPRAIGALSAPASAVPLVALAQHSFARTVGAVADFDKAMKSPDATGDTTDSEREGGATLVGGLDLAAKLLVSDAGTQIVVVSASGFDTHSNQAPTQAKLLTDLAAGVSKFFDEMTAAKLDVLLVTASEFGRRVQENGSAGTDHGAGNVSFVAGPGVKGGLYGEMDLGDLLDGDLRPNVDPRVMYTACLDWIGADPVAVLGKRYDDVKLLSV
ncbi:MAG: DUF1501 domain-containing protein [Ilumatobacteraceae bacterium]